MRHPRPRRRATPPRRRGRPGARPRPEREEAGRTGYAARLWADSVAIEGTPAESHLAVARRIPRPAGGWPASLRWHQGRRALIAAATTPAGAVPFVQLVHLDAEGRPESRGGLPKRSHGVQAGAAVRYPGDPARPLLLAEGAATGLAGWVAMGDCETRCALGSLWKLQVPRGRLVILLADDDAPEKTAKLEDWAAQLRADGYRVALVYPFAARRFDGADFADLQAEAGTEAVRARIRAAILAEQGLTPADPPFALPSATLAQAHADVARIVREFYGAQPGVAAPQILLAGESGIGKTDSVIRLLAEAMVVAQREDRPHRLIVMLPEHVTLGPQIVARFRALGLSAAAFRGRSERNCQDMPAVRDAQRIGESPALSVCRSKDAACPFYAGCQFWTDADAAADADVVVVASNYVFEKMPKAGARECRLGGDRRSVRRSRRQHPPSHRRELRARGARPGAGEG